MSLGLKYNSHSNQRTDIIYYTAFAHASFSSRIASWRGVQGMRNECLSALVELEASLRLLWDVFCERNTATWLRTPHGSEILLEGISEAWAQTASLRRRFEPILLPANRDAADELCALLNAAGAVVRDFCASRVDWSELLAFVSRTSRDMLAYVAAIRDGLPRPIALALAALCPRLWTACTRFAG
jgi:hypothetical protein